MPRATLDKEISHLRDEVLLLGSLVEEAVRGSVDSLLRRDKTTARKIYNNDRLINEKRFAIENAILVLIATQQPMAHDLRFLTSILEVTTELERIGDYAKGNAKVNILMPDEEDISPRREFTRMAELGVSMLHRALSSFLTEDTDLARTIPMEDDEVDDLYNQVVQTLIQAIIANPSTIENARFLMWVAHNLERTADRATNICERTIFITTGELMEFRSTDDEEYEDQEGEA